VQSATIFEAKTNLSKLLRHLQQGEEVLITSGRERKPVARLVAINPATTSSRIGFMEGEGGVGPEFWESLPDEELLLWNGEGK
jgi:antitoxin (DNA-binding transcriptional repressor) of toxin-antitoxin stability system